MSKEQLKQHGKTFHFASVFLSNAHHEAASQLYGVCRQLDDLADLTTDHAHAISGLTDAHQALRRRDANHPLIGAALAIEPGIDLAALEQLIIGVQSDVGSVRIQTEAELLQYCYQVAGTVGLMMCDVFSVQDPRARLHAVDLGIAMQLTNIARDVVEDALNDRRYLPASLVGELAPESILKPSPVETERLKEAVHTLLSEAELRYESGFSGLPFLPPRARLAILVAGLAYREIGLNLADRNFDLWSGRVYTTGRQKGLIALRGLVRYLTDREVHRYHGQHDPELHRGLSPAPGVDWAAR